MSKKRFSKAVKKQTLAEQVAEAITEAILAGEWEAGAALPTEPELAEQFGVSRAVVRDATRMLAAQGLVKAQHGRGVFVTASQTEAFGEALLLALRRSGATVWDIEHFEQILFPEVVALAASEVTDDELATIRRLADEYIAVYNEVISAHWGTQGNLPEPEKTLLTASFRRFFQSVFSATHNQVLTLLAQPLLELRNLRQWEDGDENTPALAWVLKSEAAYLNTIVDMLAAGDPAQARKTVNELMQLPLAAETAMRQTAIGETPVIQSPRIG